MKKLGELREHVGTNGWGAVSTTQRQAYEVEASDIGIARQHHGGLNHAVYTFRDSDVGRVIEQIEGGCWYFGSVFHD